VAEKSTGRSIDQPSRGWWRPLLVISLVVAMFFGLTRLAATLDLATTDTDGDGLPDLVETSGWRILRGDVFMTDPRSPDTDGDEVSDGDEAGPLRLRLPWERIFTGRSDPTTWDSDGDGLDDAAELEGGFNAWARDTDGDLLEDFAELEFGSDPLSRNADGDHLDDAAELSQGTDPNIYDLTGEEAGGAFAAGAVFGGWEWGARNIGGLNDEQLGSWQYLAGSIASGFVGLGDVRDLVADLGSGNWGGALIDLSALVPVLGDGAKVADSSLTFAKRGGRAMASAMHFIAHSPALDDTAKAAVIRQIVRLDPARSRLASDAGVRGTPPPLALSALRPVSRSATQNTRKDQIVRELQAQGYTDIRVDQQQVNAAGELVGINRPDIQATSPDGIRHYYELDTTSSRRGPSHMVRTLSNDDLGEVVLIVQD
jgi:hypothetical protein